MIYSNNGLQQTLCLQVLICLLTFQKRSESSGDTNFSSSLNVSIKIKIIRECQSENIAQNLMLQPCTQSVA